MTELPKHVWHKDLECVVELFKPGHYPDTVHVRLPDGRETETLIERLDIQCLPQKR